METGDDELTRPCEQECKWHDVTANILVRTLRTFLFAMTSFRYHYEQECKIAKNRLARRLKSIIIYSNWLKGVLEHP
jgi:hypothetical protein